MRPLPTSLPRNLAPVLLLGLFVFASSAGADVSEKLREGCRLLVGGRWDQAGRAFREAGGQDTSCPEALVGEGTAYLLGGLQDTAADCFARALVLDPDQPAALVGKATGAFLARDYASALDTYRLALSYDSPHHAAVRASEAQLACLLGYYEVAEGEAREATVESPGNELARQVLAAALIARGRPNQALSALSTPVDQGATGGLGIVAGSPLFVSSAKYYADNELDDNYRLASLRGLTLARERGGDAVPPQTSFNRGDGAFRIEWPRPGAKVSGKVEIAVYSAPDSGVQYIATLIDEKFVGMSNSQPFRVYLDTTVAREGLREIRVDGYGADGTIAKSAAITVNVANAQRTVSASEKALRAEITEFLEGLLVLRAHPLLRAQLIGHALEAQGRIQEAVDAYEYAFSYECTLPCIRGDLLLAYGKLGLRDAVPNHEIHSLPGEGSVALTFDDGPNPLLTPWILDLLDKYHAKATFLLVGKQVEMYPELTREILRRGHEIGCHSYTHSNLRQISNLGVERELVMCRQVIRRACGEFVTLFRPPGGNYDPQVREAVISMGFATVFWTENITSYPGQSGEEILPRMLGKIDRSGIVLLHNGFDETREVLPLLLPALSQRGLRLDTISALTSHRPFRVEQLTLYPSEWKL